MSAVKCPNWNDVENRMLVNRLMSAHAKPVLTDSDFQLLMDDMDLFEIDNKSRMKPVYQFYNLFNTLDETLLERAVVQVEMDMSLKDLKALQKADNEFLKKSTEYRTTTRRRKVQEGITAEKLAEYEKAYRAKGWPVYSFDKASSNKTLVTLAQHLMQLNPTVNIEFVSDGVLKGRANAMIQGNTYFINADKASITDLLHEHGHMFMVGLKVSEPWYYSQLVTAALEHPRYAEFKALYPELNQEQLGEEIFVELLAERASQVYATQWWDNHNKLFGEVLDKGVAHLPFKFDRSGYESNLRNSLAEVIDNYAEGLLKQSVTGRKKKVFEYILEEQGIDPANLSAEEVSIMQYLLNTRFICQ